MVSSLLLAAIASYFAAQVSAQNGDIALCTAAGCYNCPTNLPQQGTGYPKCVIYDRTEVLGQYADEYKDTESSDKESFYNIPEVSDDTCRTIIRTPADTDDENCGVPLYGGKGPACSLIDTKSTRMVQFCCGSGDCSAAGVEKRSTGSASLTSMVLKDVFGNLLVPHSVGENGVDLLQEFMDDRGVNASSHFQSLNVLGQRVFLPLPSAPMSFRAAKNQKCDCTEDNAKYVADGDTYTKTGDMSIVVSDYICGSTSTFSITNSHRVSHTTSFSASISDPFGIMSTSIGFSTETSAGQDYTYMFTPEESQCGHVAWTAFFTCTKGTISGCGDDSSYTGDVCTAKRISNNQIVGAYTFVETG